MAHTYSHLFHIPTTGLRFFTVYGPWGRPDMAPILFANAISKGDPIKVFNNGDLERDFTFIDDIVEGLVRILSHPPESKNVQDNFSSFKKEESPDRKRQGEVVDNTLIYRIFNIGNGNPVKLLDFIETMESAIGKKAVKEMYPMQPGDVYKTFADVKKLKEKYGYEPDTNLKEGIGEFVKWYKSYYR